MIKATAKIRCYCHGFGDCFLIQFNSGERELKIVIDCGILKGAANEADRIKCVIRDIQEATNSRIDVLVMTHEHWDHISGFHHAPELWKAISVEAVWMAWTEDPDNVAARRLETAKRTTEQALRLAINRMSPLSRVRDQVQSLLGFSDDMRTARDTIRSKGKSVTYWNPGQKETSLLEGLEVFFLGPPTDEKRLRSTGGDIKKSLLGLEYGLGVKVESDENKPTDYQSHMRRALGLDYKLHSPFSQNYSLSEPPLESPYFEKQSGWRQLDRQLSDGEADRLSLQLDSLTNNTSLVIAFRLNGKDVLLFPGDAQGGNWKSWTDSESEPGIVERLLAQTRFYKVGHHGSHNGTIVKDRYELISKEAAVFMPFEPVKKWPTIPDSSLVRLFQRHRLFVSANESDKAKVLSETLKGYTKSESKVPGTDRPLWVEISF